MAYQKKYFSQFISIDNKTHLIEIWQNSETAITASEVTLMDSPFIVQLPEVGIFTPVLGTGCELNMLSNTNMQFFGSLYHVDPKEILVKHYIDGAINWLGYLNSETSRESYDQLTKYAVQFIGNDGFALLDRFYFLQLDGSNYIGVKSLFDVISICIQKIGLPFTYLNISLATTFTGWSGAASSTVFHEQHIDCSNFYDEDNQPFTLRKVLESVLQPFAAFIVQLSGDLYITDTHTIAQSGSITYKRFLLSNLSYAGTTVKTVSKTLSGVGYRGTGQEIKRSGGKNKQVVTYSPYPRATVFENTINSTEEFGGSVFNWQQTKFVFYRELYQNKTWQALGDGVNLPEKPSRFEIVKKGVDKIKSYANVAAFPLFGKPDITYKATDTGQHYRWNGAVYVQISDPVEFGGEVSIHYSYPYFATNTKLLWLRPGLTISANPKADGSNFFFLNIKGKFGVATNRMTAPWTLYLNNVWLMWKISIGNKWYNGAKWTTTEQFFYTRISQEGDPVFSNLISFGLATGWPNMINLANNGEDSLRILLNDTLIGELSIELYSEFRTDTMSPYNSEFENKINRFFIGDLSVAVVRADGTEINNNDVEYIGLLDPLFKDEAEGVTLYCGTDSTGADRAKLLSQVSGGYSPIESWTRAGQTFKIEELLLNSLSSNYRSGSIKLNNLKLKNNFDLLSIFTDTYTGAAKLRVKSASILHRDNIAEVSLEEIKPDELTIIPL